MWFLLREIGEAITPFVNHWIACATHCKDLFHHRTRFKSFPDTSAAHTRGIFGLPRYNLDVSLRERGVENRTKPEHFLELLQISVAIGYDFALVKSYGSEAEITDAEIG